MKVFSSEVRIEWFSDQLSFAFHLYSIMLGFCGITVSVHTLFAAQKLEQKPLSLAVKLAQK